MIGEAVKNITDFNIAPAGNIQIHIGLSCYKNTGQ